MYCLLKAIENSWNFWIIQVVMYRTSLLPDENRRGIMGFLINTGFYVSYVYIAFERHRESMGVLNNTGCYVCMYYYLRIIMNAWDV